MLISVHLPKTAGSSFSATLEEHFQDRLFRDYTDLPLHRGRWRSRVRAVTHAVGRPNTEPARRAACIHGHFLPLKYRFLRCDGPRLFVTGLREPVQRLLSHYYFWQRSYDPGSAGPLHHRMVKEQWSLKRFALGPELCDLYCLFLWRFPLRRFAFVGITEHLDADLSHFGERFLGRSAAIAARNAGPEGVGARHVLEAGLEARIRAHHRRDVALYERALALRNRRLGEDG